MVDLVAGLIPLLLEVETGMDLEVVGVEGLEEGEGLQESAAVTRGALPETAEDGEGISEGGCRRELFESEEALGEAKIREASDWTGVEGSMSFS